MKKHKTSDRKPAHFNNNPFKSLKGLKPAANAGSSKETKRLRKETNEDDADLFLRAVSGTRSINPENDGLPGLKHVSIPQSAGVPEREQEIFLQAMRKIGTRLRETEMKPEIDDTERRSNSSRLKQLKRGTIQIREELDLHGHIKHQALVKLEHFITSAYSRGRKAVLVITGKGINSPEGPVLQGAVADWLEGKGKQMVAEFAPAPRDKGGSGAFVVFLKSR